MNRVESQDAWKTTWKANGAEAPSFVSLGADEAYWMRTVSGGGCWDLKCSVPPKNPGAEDGMAGMRGTNKFLEDVDNFNGIAVSRCTIELGIWTDNAREYICFPHIQMHTSSSPQLEKPSQIFPSLHGSTTTRWRRRCLLLCRRCSQFRLSLNRASSKHRHPRYSLYRHRSQSFSHRSNTNKHTNNRSSLRNITAAHQRHLVPLIIAALKHHCNPDHMVHLTGRRRIRSTATRTLMPQGSRADTWAEYIMPAVLCTDDQAPAPD